MTENKTEIWIVVIDDRHTDPEVTVFTDAAAATAFAERQIQNYAHHPELIEPEDRELNKAMTDAGWIWYCRYSSEGDSAWVIRSELSS
jgi:hypothetical protein